MTWSCHAGGRGFESRRSRFRKCLQIADFFGPTGGVLGPDLATQSRPKRQLGSSDALRQRPVRPAVATAHESERILEFDLLAKVILRALENRGSVALPLRAVQ